jgi:hypothetical protein
MSYNCKPIQVTTLYQRRSKAAVKKKIIPKNILKRNRSQQLQHMSCSCKPTQVTALYQRRNKATIKGKKYSK